VFPGFLLCCVLFLFGGAVLAIELVKHLVLPGLAVIDAGVLGLDPGQALEKQLAEVAQHGGVAHRKPIAGHEDERFAEDVIDGRGGLELVVRAEKLFGELADAQELLLLTPVMKTKRSATAPAGHLAAAAIGIGEAAARRRFLLGLRGHV